MKKIAVICYNFSSFRHNVPFTDLEFIPIKTIEDTRGRVFNGYIVLYDADNLNLNIEELITIVKTRIIN